MPQHLGRRRPFGRCKNGWRFVLGWGYERYCLIATVI
jgi:hypothetical protein